MVKHHFNEQSKLQRKSDKIQTLPNIMSTEDQVEKTRFDDVM